MKHSNLFLLSTIVFSMLFNQTKANELSVELQSTAEARNIAKSFGGMLKPKLKTAIQTDGLQHAINVCAIEAPKIAKELSEKTGWSVKRVSLKPRNKNSASPDTFERMILEQFDRNQVEGKSSKTIEHAEIVGNQFRYMKAQMVEGVCLNCHGGAISPDTKEAIKKQYPEDIAMGYSLGQIRGAFSLIKDL